MKQFFYFKRFLFLFAALAFSFTTFSQQDTLSGKEMDLLKMVGGLIKNVTGEAFKGNDFKKDGLLGGTIKNVLKRTTEKSIRQLGVPGGFLNNPRAIIQLPDQLKNLENNFQQFGKKQLLDNLLTSMNESASEALSNLAPVIAGKMVDMAIDKIIENANSDDSTFTNAFDRMFRKDLKLEILPLVEKGMKVYRTTKTMRKINKLVKRKKLGSLDFDLNDHVASRTLDGLFGLMKDEELNIRKNPASLLDKLIDMIKN